MLKKSLPPKVNFLYTSRARAECHAGQGVLLVWSVWAACPSGER